MKGMSTTQRTKEERAVLLCLTRIAHFFYASSSTYTGPEVADIVLAAWHSYEQSKIEVRDRRGISELAADVTCLPADQTTIAEQCGQQSDSEQRVGGKPETVNAGDRPTRPRPQESLLADVQPL